MADTDWQGTTGDLTLAGNWTNGVPGNGDRGFFRAGLGSVGPSTNMTGLADTLALLHIGRGFAFDIGGSVNHMQVSATKIEHFGNGKLWFKDDAATTVDAIIDAPGGAELTGDTITNVHVLRGPVTLAGGLGATALVEVGRVLTATDASVIIEASAGTTTTFKQWGGTCTAKNLITNGQIYGGTAVKEDVEFDNLDLFAGTVQVMNANTMDLVNLYGGILDMKSFGGPQTITVAWRFPGSTLLQVPSLLTIGTDNDYRGEAA